MEATALALSILKITTFLAVTTGLITGVYYFNTAEFNGKKKGGRIGESDEIKSLREKLGSRS